MAGTHEWRTGQHSAHDLALHADAASMDNAYGFQSERGCFFKIRFDNRGGLAWMNRV